MTQIVSNTTKSYPCTMCGSPGNIVREGQNPRLKCMGCNFMYDASDSLELVRQGKVPTAPPKIEEPKSLKESPIAGETKDVSTSPDIDYNSHSLSYTRSVLSHIPRSAEYILVSKARNDYEFATKKDFKKKLLKWESSGRGYDVYQLNKLEFTVKVDVVE